MTSSSGSSGLESGSSSTGVDTEGATSEGGTGTTTEGGGSSTGFGTTTE